MIFRSLWAAVGAVAFSLAACQTVHTQTPSAGSSTPSPLGEPVSMTLGAPAPSPSATVTATPSPSPIAPPARLSYTLVPGAGRTVAMTFDDGPSPKLTPLLLDILKARGIHATFFVVGQNAAEYPDILKRAVAEGHEIANHSWSHPQLTKLSADGVASQVEKTNAAIKAAIGHDPTLIRPPYGATNATLDRRFNQKYGLKVILWDVDPLDWKYRNAAHVQREILSQVKPGSIVLSHDIHASTVAAMPATLDALIAKGYKFATVSELIAMEGSVPTPTPIPKVPKASLTSKRHKASAEITPPPFPVPVAPPAPVETQPFVPSGPAINGSAAQ